MLIMRHDSWTLMDEVVANWEEQMMVMMVGSWSRVEVQNRWRRCDEATQPSICYSATYSHDRFLEYDVSGLTCLILFSA